MSEYTLHHGDCLDILPTLAPQSVDAVICDPPYSLPARYHNSNRVFYHRSLSDLSMLEYFYREWFKQCDRILKPTGSWYLCCDSQSYPVFYALLFGIAKRIVTLVWDKGTSVNGYSWRHQHELILFAEMQNYPVIPTGDGDVIRMRSVPTKDKLHAAEKPLELFERFVEKSTDKDAVVLDPFMGSGTTGAACGNLGRRFVGIEKDLDYFNTAQERIATAYEPLRMMQVAV